MATQHILQVSELTKKVRFILESELNTVWLCGEISNFIAASSGHWYLSLKDQKSQVRCAMFKGSNRRVKLQPQNGQQVLVRAKVSLYEPRGDFQLIIEHMEDAGEGMLRQQYQQLKDKLNREGLFAQHHKQAIPKKINTIGVVTSPTGAAIKDILTVLKRRNPLLKVIIYPCLVQGEQAKCDIESAIYTANQRQEVDVLIVGRGGGSLEDLWPFNEEQVARAIYDSSLPIISAVGHEIDTVLCDFVADLRAPTPSAAAELVSTTVTDYVQQFSHLQSRALAALKQQISQYHQQQLVVKHRLNQVHPSQQLNNQQQKLDSLNIRFQQLLTKPFIQKNNLHLLQQRLAHHNPQTRITQAKQRQQQLLKTLHSQHQQILNKKSLQFASLCEQLHLVSPLATIARGYSVCRNEKQEVVKALAQVQLEEDITVQVSDGYIQAKVINKASE